MPKNLVPAKKRPAPQSRPARSGPAVVTGVKKVKAKPKNATASIGTKSKIKKVLGSVARKLKEKKPIAKKETKEKLKKVIEKKLPVKKAVPDKPKKKVSALPKKQEKASTKKEKDEAATVKEPVEVVISVKKPKAKAVVKNEPKPGGVTSGKINKKNVSKAGQMKKDILKKLSGKMDEKLETVVNTILEVAVVKKVHSPKPKVMEDKKKSKEPIKKKSKDSKEVKTEQKKTEIKEEKVDVTDTSDVMREAIKEISCKVEDKKTEDKPPVKFKAKVANDDDVRKMEIKKEIIDEFLEEEEKQSKAKLEKKKIMFLKKPKTKVAKEVSKKESEGPSGSVAEKLTDIKIDFLPDVEDDKTKKKVDSPKSVSACNSGQLVKKKSRARPTKKKPVKNKSGDEEEKSPNPADSGSVDLDDMDEETKAKRMKLYGFWAGPKRHRVASLNAIAKVHCLYENESRGAMMEMLDKSVAKIKVDKKKTGQRNKSENDSDERKDSDDSVPEVPPKRSLRTAPGNRSVGLHYDVETSSSSPCSSSSSEAETEDENSGKKEKPETPSKPPPKVEKGKGKGKVKLKKPSKTEEVVDEIEKDESTKKVRKRRRRCELMMDLKDMVVRKRMASLNASAMLAATYSVEKKTTVKSDDDKRKRSSNFNSTTTDTQSSTDVEPESSDDEVILSGSSKKVAVIVNQDTDVTITGLYLNSTTRSTRHCSITGMQYRISSTSHTQTEGAAVTTETVIHTTDHVSVSHSSSSSSVEAVGSPGGSCKSYTPLGALSSMQPPGNSSPLMRRHPCSSSAFSAPPPYHHHHHQDMHGECHGMPNYGYYQPAGPLISHHYHAGASSSSTSLPAVIAPPPQGLSSKGSPGPPAEQTSTSRPPGEPPSDPPPPPPPQEYRPPPPPFASPGYPPPPPHHNYYPYLQPPYQECYNPYLKYSPHPGFRRTYWPGHGGSPSGGGPSAGPMVSGGPDSYHGGHGGPPSGGPIEPYPPPHHHQVPQGPPQPAAYYYPHSGPPPPTCYSHPAPLRAPLFMPESSYQACPCPSMSTFPKNVLTGPLTGASKGSVQTQAQNSAAQMGGDQPAQAQLQSTQAAHGVAQGGPTAAQPNVALALTLETNNPLRGPPSPARGSAGLPTPASPALSTAQQPTSWSPPVLPPETKPVTKQEPCDEIKRSTERSPPPPLTLVADEPQPPVLENQLQAAQRRPRPPKRKPSIERQVSPVPDENLEPPVLEDTKPILLAEPEPVEIVQPKRRRSATPLRSKSEPAKVGTRQSKKPGEKLTTNLEKKPKLQPDVQEAAKPVCNGHSKAAPKILESQKKVNGLVGKLAPKATVQKMLLKNSSPNTQSIVAATAKAPIAPKAAVAPIKAPAALKGKKENCKAKAVKSEPKKACKKLAKKATLALPHPVRNHLKGLKWSNGWSWEGEGFKARVFLAGDESPVYRKCYQAMRHVEGDIICPMDCILLKSGPRKQQLPFIAKVASLWENPDDGEMMISLLWYYRPEHTDQGRQPLQPDDEVFASRHRDTNSVACIEDKCYVLTFNEYCRYKKLLRAADYGVSLDRNRMVPLADSYPRSRRLPQERIAKELLFFCRKVYDFRTKRLQKNPAKC